MKIGYERDAYFTRRNIIGRINDAEYIKARDLFSACVKARRIWRKLRGLRPVRDKRHLYYSFHDFGFNSVDLLHFYNTVSFGRTPWVSTFETMLPRFGESPPEKMLRRGFEALAGNACRRLIAMSRCSMNIQLAFLEHAGDRAPAIAEKITCLHPPQPLLFENYDDKPTNLADPIRFVFVGHAFFRKGGLETLETLVRLRNAGANLKLVVVSALKLDPYAAGESWREIQKANRLFEKHKRWIRHHRQLGNPRVLELMKHCHVGLLPTYADTYGFAALESQAAACPVISTNVRALPEINSPETGWLIEVPKDNLGEGRYATPEARAALSQAIRRGLEQTIESIFKDRSVIAAKGAAALQKIRRDHCPDRYAQNLAAIYRQALDAS